MGQNRVSNRWNVAFVVLVIVGVVVVVVHVFHVVIAVVDHANLPLKSGQEQLRYWWYWVCVGGGGGGGWTKVIFVLHPNFELSWGGGGVVTRQIMFSLSLFI